MSWLPREQRTARLVQGVFRQVSSRLTVSDIWNLCRLTWITKNPRTGHVSDAYRKSTKYPALINLLDIDATEGQEEKIVRSCARCMRNARDLVLNDTGIVNFYGPFRNVSKHWIAKHGNQVRDIVTKAACLRSDAKAEGIQKAMLALPSIRLASNNAPLPPSNLLSPLLACLDPRSRFPIINGPVTDFLSKIGLGAKNELSQYTSLVKLLDVLRLRDAFKLDTQIGSTNDSFVQKCKKALCPASGGRTLRLRDESDITALMRHRCKRMRRLHNTMTNRLAALIGSGCEEGADRGNLWDVLVRSRRPGEKNILLEVKSACDVSSARMAVGQLYDYRRFVTEAKNIDLAVLFPSRPGHDVRKYLQSIPVRCLWFTGRNMAAVRDVHEIIWE